MNSTIGHQLRAWGRYPTPRQITLGKHSYRQRLTFKHDFFAVTALYELTDRPDLDNNNPPHKIVLKLARRADFLGLPLLWLGRSLATHEIATLEHLQYLPQTPRFLARYGETGLIYEYIEGATLDEKPELPDDFFDHLHNLLEQIHDRQIAYIDMDKRGNILLGRDNLPYLIDFQLASYIPKMGWPLRKIAHFLLEILQKEDFYHLLKHKRRLSSHLMTTQQISESRRKSPWIIAHRIVARLLTRLRRGILSFLFRTNRLITDDIAPHSSESNPARWTKQHH